MSLLEIVPSAARSVDGTAGFGGWSPERPLACILNVTAVSGGSPSMNLHLEESYDGINWFATGTFVTSISAAGFNRMFLEDNGTPLPPHYRFRWVIGGSTPSFTFSVSVYSQP